MKFTFKIASEEMKTACEKLRFGGGNAVSFYCQTGQWILPRQAVGFPQ